MQKYYTEVTFTALRQPGQDHNSLVLHTGGPGKCVTANLTLFSLQKNNKETKTRQTNKKTTAFVMICIMKDL